MRTNNLSVFSILLGGGRVCPARCSIECACGYREREATTYVFNLVVPISDVVIVVTVSRYVVFLITVFSLLCVMV